MFGFLISIFRRQHFANPGDYTGDTHIDGDIRAEKDIATLSRQIDSTFCVELQHAYRELEIIDEEVIRKYNASFGADDTPTRQKHIRSAF